MAEHRVAPVVAADPQLEDRGAVVDRRTQAIDARHRRDDDHVAALEQRVGGGVAEPVDLLVPARVLLDVRVRPRQVRLGLVVVEVADEVLDRVVGEELAELGVQLGGQRLVVGQDQRRLLVTLDGLGHRVRLAAAGHAQERLVAEAAREPVDELVRSPAAGRRWARRGRRDGSRARLDRTTRPPLSNGCSGSRGRLRGLARPAAQPACSAIRTARRTGTNDPFARHRPSRRLRRSSTARGSTRPYAHGLARPPPPPAGGPHAVRGMPSGVPTAPRRRAVAGRVLADPRAAAVHPSRDHPVRVHLQLGRDPVHRRPRGGSRRLGLRLRPEPHEAGQRHRAEQQGQDHPARVDERPREDEPAVLRRDHVDELHQRDDDDLQQR